MEENVQSNAPMAKPPTVLDGLMQPGFPVKVFTCLFFEKCVVFCKTGSFATDSAGTMRSALGGYTGAGLIMGAVGGLIDAQTNKNRTDQAASMATIEPENIVAAHKLNFSLSYDSISRIELKGPNFAGEFRIIVYANGKSEKYRMDKQSKSTAKYIIGVFSEYIPGKVIVK